MTELTWKIGFEIEMLAPPGRSRRDLADALAGSCGGHVRRCFYPQSEPSLVPGQPVFENLILGFDVVDADGAPFARCVDDLTIRADLNREAPPEEGWYRVLSDDARILRLVMAQCDPQAGLDDVLQPLAKLFGTQPKSDGADIIQVVDAINAPVALDTGLPGERHRPCELITPPLVKDHISYLRRTLSIAKDLDFKLPAEAATHIHFDAGPLMQAGVFSNLVQVLARHGSGFRMLMNTNPHCVRLGPLPRQLVKLVSAEEFSTLDWPEARKRLGEVPLSKYCDFNLFNMVQNIPGKATFEIRILPGLMEAEEIVERTALFQAVLDWCLTRAPGTAPERDFGRFVGSLDLSPDLERRWKQEAAKRPNRSWFRPN